MNRFLEIPRPGMFATVRNRRGIIAGVEPFDGESGRLHLVQVDYKDDQSPAEERLIWEAGAALRPCARAERSPSSLIGRFG